MQRIPVDSTDLVAVGYDAKARVLEIEFKEGRIYQYLDVEPDVHQRFMRADSYGEYFFAHINKHYRYKKVEEVSAAAGHKLAFISGNPEKAEDLRAVCKPFGIDFDVLDLPVDEIQSHEPEKIALHKAKQAYKLAGGRPVVVQDTFWNILALRGFPGAYMRYISEWFRREDFIAFMAGKQDRTVLSTHAVTYFDGKRSKLFTKDFMGTIAQEPRGNSRYSIDKVVISAGQTRTIAEIREQDGVSPIAPEDSAWHQFAKWYSLHRRLGKA